MQYNFDEIIDRRDTQAIKYDYRVKYFGNEDLIPMWIADMDFRTPGFIMEAIRKRTRHEVLGYSHRPPSWYEAIINWYGRRQGWEIKDEWLLFSPGVVAALSMAVRAYSSEGEKVIIQPPVYHPFFSVIKENNRVPLYNPLLEENGRYRMDLEGLKKQLGPKVKLILLCHPHNPTGRVWIREELQELSRICLENNILIVSDEIHSDLVFRPHQHIPMPTLSDEVSDITVACVAPSKTFNLAGLASSVVVIKNKDLRDKFSRELSSGHFYMGNVFGNIAMETAYREGDDWLGQLMEYLRGNRDYLVQMVETELPRVRISPIEATYLAWLDMRDLGMKRIELRKFMAEKVRIGCNDGPSFGPQGEGFQRLNFACPRSILEQALTRLKQALGKRN
jgi:cystathionine beta-lyase